MTDMTSSCPMQGMRPDDGLRSKNLIYGIIRSILKRIMAPGRITGRSLCCSNMTPSRWFPTAQHGGYARTTVCRAPVATLIMMLHRLAHFRPICSTGFIWYPLLAGRSSLKFLRPLLRLGVSARSRKSILLATTSKSRWQVPPAARMHKSGHSHPTLLQ